MAEAYQYPPELFTLLVDTIPLLCRSKSGVISFLQGAGVAHEDMLEVENIVRRDRDAITKYDIVRNVLTKTNSRGDSGLRARREILRRVVEFESFEICWPDDQYKAKGLIASIREVIHARDSFTRMQQERDKEYERASIQNQAIRAAAAKKRALIEDVSKRLAALFAMDDRPQERGKLLETVLNDLFRAYGILVHEDFRRKDPDSSVVLEQIDGVIELEGVIHLVEMKWLNSPVGIGEFSPHLSRLFLRANARGIFIATNGYTASVLSESKTALTAKTIFLCSLKEFVMMLQRQGDLVELLKKKSHAAIVEKNPFLEIL